VIGGGGPPSVPALRALLICAVAILPIACGGAERVETPPGDPVGLALWIGEGRVVCDLEHARRGEGLDHGWTAYTPAPAPAVAAARAARARLEQCRETVEPGTRVVAALESSDAGRAVVVLRTIAPSGAGTTERMRFRRSHRSWVWTG
jgi:hypothetical protein